MDSLASEQEMSLSDAERSQVIKIRPERRITDISERRPRVCFEEERKEESGARMRLEGESQKGEWPDQKTTVYSPRESGHLGM